MGASVTVSSEPSPPDVTEPGLAREVRLDSEGLTLMQVGGLGDGTDRGQRPLLGLRGCRRGGRALRCNGRKPFLGSR